MNKELFFLNLQKLCVKQREVLIALMENMQKFQNFSVLDDVKIKKIIGFAVKNAMSNPFDFFRLQSDMSIKINQLYVDFFRCLTEFSEENTNRSFNEFVINKCEYLLNSIYKINKEFLNDYFVNKLDFDEKLQNYARFILNYCIDFFDPTYNFFLNRDVIEHSYKNNFQNIIDGLENFINDLKNSGSVFNLQTVRYEDFVLGENIATTEGKVVFENKLCQLIHYKPNQKTHKTPIFIVPPWINKYYILDLSRHNSMVKWLIDSDFEVFLISWANPDSSYRDVNFEDYLKLGILESINYLEKFGYNEFAGIGYCIGGTLLACAASYFSEKSTNKFVSATFLTTILDFKDSGDIGLFVDEKMITKIEKSVLEKGYIDGKIINYWFSILRFKDLFWRFFVNNYLFGRSPSKFDILYWNADSTNLPASMYVSYLRDMYVNNLLKKGEFCMLDVKIKLKKIKIPTFFFAAIEDHISPWKSVFNGSKLVSGNKTLCLGLSGHVNGVINHPKSSKYGYYTVDTKEKFDNGIINKSNFTSGSWWLYWMEWQIKNADMDIVDNNNYHKTNNLEKAPGSYVKIRV